MVETDTRREARGKRKRKTDMRPVVWSTHEHSRWEQMSFDEGADRQLFVI